MTFYKYENAPNTEMGTSENKQRLHKVIKMFYQKLIANIPLVSD